MNLRKSIQSDLSGLLRDIVDTLDSLEDADLPFDPAIMPDVIEALHDLNRLIVNNPRPEDQITGLTERERNR